VDEAQFVNDPLARQMQQCGGSVDQALVEKTQRVPASAALPRSATALKDSGPTPALIARGPTPALAFALSVSAPVPACSAPALVIPAMLVSLVDEVLCARSSANYGKDKQAADSGRANAQAIHEKVPVRRVSIKRVLRNPTIFVTRSVRVGLDPNVSRSPFSNMESPLQLNKR
jgi:hypothetical protein